MSRLKGVSIAGLTLIIFCVGGLVIRDLRATPSQELYIDCKSSVFRDVRFMDLADGSISVRDAIIEDEVARLLVGSSGFVRSTIRSLENERRQRRVPSGAPFRITDCGNGRLTLLDSVTGRLIELSAFGINNSAAFSEFLR